MEVLSLVMEVVAFSDSVSYHLFWRWQEGATVVTEVVFSSGGATLSALESVSFHELNAQRFVSHPDSHAREERLTVAFPQGSFSPVDIDRASKHEYIARIAKSLTKQR